MKRTDELVARAKELRAKGEPYWVIAGELDVSEMTARNWADDEAREANRLRAAQYRQPITSPEQARDFIAKLAGCSVIGQPRVKCSGEWAGGLNIKTTNGPVHVDRIDRPQGVSRRQLYLACRKLNAVAGG